MLDVADVDELMFQLRNFVPVESTISASKIKSSDCVVHYAVAKITVSQNLRLRIWLWYQRQILVWVRLMLFPWAEGGFVRLKVQMSKVQGVVSNLPECVLVACL